MLSYSVRPFTAWETIAGRFRPFQILYLNNINQEGSPT